MEQRQAVPQYQQYRSLTTSKAIEQADDRKVTRPRAQPSTPDERSEAIHSLDRRVVLLGLRWIEEAAHYQEPR